MNKKNRRVSQGKRKKKKETLISRQNARKKSQHQPDSSKYKNLNILTEDENVTLKKRRRGNKNAF